MDEADRDVLGTVGDVVAQPGALEGGTGVALDPVRPGDDDHDRRGIVGPEPGDVAGQRPAIRSRTGVVVGGDHRTGRTGPCDEVGP